MGPETTPGLGGADGFGFTQAQPLRRRVRGRGREAVDAVHNGLDGQPPVARSGGWGDMSWVHSR